MLFWIDIFKNLGLKTLRRLLQKSEFHILQSCFSCLSFTLDYYFVFKCSQCPNYSSSTPDHPFQPEPICRFYETHPSHLIYQIHLHLATKSYVLIRYPREKSQRPSLSQFPLRQRPGQSCQEE